MLRRGTYIFRATLIARGGVEAVNKLSPSNGLISGVGRKRINEIRS